VQSRNRRKTKTKDGYKKLTRLGLLLVALASLGAVIIFFPVLVKEVTYIFSKPDENTPVASSELDSMRFFNEKDVIIAKDPLFSIIIPKIGANSKVISDVDSQDSKVYQVALTKGVAHAKGSAYPGEIGNSFYFAHSSDNFYNANRYNSVFYLLNKMEKGDFFYLVYKNWVYKYIVTETSIVEPEEVRYLENNTDKKMATLMTCWPAGTTISRLVVVGELVEE